MNRLERRTLASQQRRRGLRTVLWTCPPAERDPHPYPTKPKASPATKPVTFANMYRPPFKHVCGYFYDADGHTVCDMRPGIGVRARGWGRLQYLPDGDRLHDEAEAAIAKATAHDPNNPAAVLAALATIWPLQIRPSSYPV